ncbi:MAG: ATP-binding protein [Ignavibacteriales bacterium]|nr:MAG: ATP-binding protein [Ignavibacteriales bacterium]
MEDVCEQFNLYPGGKNIIIEKGSENMDFFTDKVLIRRILSNMMKNAVEATEDNKPVKIGCKRNKDFIEFSIRNPGYMEKEVQLQIFQRSFTTKGFDRGIGTYSMKLLCENYLMGKISFTSSKEEGTTFYCSIPVNLE